PDVEALGHVVAAVDLGLAGQRKPIYLRMPFTAQHVNKVALRREGVVEEHRLPQVQFRLHVHVDQVAGSRALQVGYTAGKIPCRARVNVQIQVRLGRKVRYDLTQVARGCKAGSTCPWRAYKRDPSSALEGSL